MPLTELKNIIQHFKHNKDDTPIALNDLASCCYAVQELSNSCASIVHAFIYFDDNGESTLFDAMHDDKTSEIINHYLEHGKVNILTNDTAKTKKLPFVVDKLNNCNVDIIPIPKKLAKSIQENKLDNEFFLSAPENIVFIGRYNLRTKSRLTEVSSFLNLFDQSLYETLFSFYEKIIKRAKSGEYR